MTGRPASYGDVTGEYLTTRRDAGVALATHDLAWVTGPDSISFLDGQLSQDIAGLPVGGVARSLLLEPRGKLRALLWVLRDEGRVGLVADAGVGAAAAEHLERFRFRVDAVITMDSRPTAMVWGPGVQAHTAAAGLGTRRWSEADGVLVADLGIAVPRLFVAGDVDAVLPDARPIGTVAETSIRIEAGEPVMGVDLDESTIPHESGLVPEAVSFTKGCYLGQELVARIDSRGHVNRHLRGVVLRDTVLPPPGAELFADGDAVGSISSVGESLELRAPVALGLVRREVAPGTIVEVRWPGGSATAEVRGLPLDDFA